MLQETSPELTDIFMFFYFGVQNQSVFIFDHDTQSFIVQYLVKL